MGPGGTLGLKHGVSRIDDLTTREFASCCGVNLAGCIRVLWFVVCGLGLWAWWFGASGCFAMGTRACGTVEMPATRDGPLPRSQPGAPALSSSPRHSSLFISFRGPNGPCRTARKALPTPPCQQRARCHPVKPTAGVPGTPVLGTPGFAPILIPRPKAGVSTVGFWLRSGQAPAVAVFRGNFRFCRHPETTI
jgi:hypothetical protein